jgi:hypothetical protein
VAESLIAVESEHAATASDDDESGSDDDSSDSDVAYDSSEQ